MIGKIIFKVGVATIAPKIIGVLVTTLGVTAVSVGGHAVVSKTKYKYDKKAKDDTMERLKEADKDYTKMV